MSEQPPSLKELLARRTSAGASQVSPTQQSSTSPVAPQKITSSPEIPSQTPRLSDNQTHEAFIEKLGEISKKEREQEVARQAKTFGMESIELKGFPISPEALRLIPKEQAQELGVIPFLFQASEIRLGVLHPEKPDGENLLYQLTERHKARGKCYMISEESFEHACKLYDALPKIISVVKGVEISERDLEEFQEQLHAGSDLTHLIAQANVTDILTVIIAAALDAHSSDIHVEAEEKGICIRFRVDGMLQEIARIEKEQWKKIISRIKLIGSLKMNISDKAQDGRFTILQQQQKIDVRVSTIPTAFGESVVMRLLTPDAIALPFDALGFRPAVLKKVIREIERPNGMIITTGPTGSGKTTTLYAMLKKLNTPDVKIITLEDPVEYKLEGVNQSQIDAAKEYTFAKGLRSLLRQDPDIVMVGEIRDLETAETAIQAALTGHLLFSTIHTNDAAGAIPRFLSMGVTPHLLAPAINAIIGQRLLRKLCTTCKKEVPLLPEDAERIREHLQGIPINSGETVPDFDQLHWYGPGNGCGECRQGYRGRVGTYEVLIKNDALEQAILKSNGSLSEYEMRALAKEQGSLTMVQDALLKASEGLTSVEEVKRILGL